MRFVALDEAQFRGGMRQAGLREEYVDAVVDIEKRFAGRAISTSSPAMSDVLPGVPPARSPMFWQNGWLRLRQVLSCLTPRNVGQSSIRRGTM